MKRHHQRKLQKVRTSIGTSWSGLHQRHATTTTTSTDQIKISMGAVGVTNQGNLCKGTPFNLTQVALIATLVTPVAPVLVLVWSVVVVVVVVACFWCSPLQLAPMLVLTFSNLRWWCFIFQPLVQILHLHACNLHCVVVVVWWCLNICGSCVWWL